MHAGSAPSDHRQPVHVRLWNPQWGHCHPGTTVQWSSGYLVALSLRRSSVQIRPGSRSVCRADKSVTLGQCHSMGSIPAGAGVIGRGAGVSHGPVVQRDKNTAFVGGCREPRTGQVHQGCVAQLAEQRSPKTPVPGSSPDALARPEGLSWREAVGKRLATVRAVQFRSSLGHDVCPISARRWESQASETGSQDPARQVRFLPSPRGQRNSETHLRPVGECRPFE